MIRVRPIRSKLLLVSAALLAAGLYACSATPGGVDYFSTVAGPCAYTAVDPSIIQTTDAERQKSSLRPACKAALEKVLPLDATFDTAPAGFKEKVLEAFQVLVAYPLALPPQNRILGVAPWSIPLGFLCGVLPEQHPGDCQVDVPENDHPNLNQDIFNFVVNNIDRLTYKPTSPSGSATAQMVPTAAGERVMTVFDAFWANDIYTALFHTPFANASTLVHEARHADGYLHTNCPNGGGFNCDEELNAPYGYGSIYEELLVRGSGTAKDTDGNYILSLGHLMILGDDICTTLHDRVIHLPPALRALLDASNCGDVSARWLLGQEGLHRDDLDP